MMTITEITDGVVDMIDMRLEQIDRELPGNALDEVRELLHELLEAQYGPMER